MLPTIRQMGTPTPEEMIVHQYSESATEQIANNLHTSECTCLELLHRARGRWRD